MKLIFDNSESAAPFPIIEEAPKITEEDFEEDYEDDEETITTPPNQRGFGFKFRN